MLSAIVVPYRLRSYSRVIPDPGVNTRGQSETVISVYVLAGAGFPLVLKGSCSGWSSCPSGSEPVSAGFSLISGGGGGGF